MGESKGLPSLGPISGLTWILVLAGIVGSGVILAVVLTLPETYTCDSGEVNYYVKLIDKPSLSSVEPSIVCPYYEDKEVLVKGWPFMVYNDQLPDLSFYGMQDLSSDNCTDFPLRGQHAKLCSILKVKVPLKALNETYFSQRVRVVLPLPTPPHATAAPRVPCVDEREDLLTLVPAPIALRVDPPVFCNSSTPANATVSGSFFLSIDNAVPTVSIGSISPAQVFLSECVDIPAKGPSVKSCSSLTFTFNPQELLSDLNDVKITNPSPADCTAANTVQFRVTNAPQLLSVTPQLVCATDSPSTLTIDGNGFLVVNGVTGTAYVGNTYISNITASSCTDISIKANAISSCMSVTFDIPAQLPIIREQGPFSQMINFSNPLVSSDCTSSLDNLVITAPPMVDLASPPRFCNEMTDVPLTLAGPGYLYVDGIAPAVTVGGSPAPVAQGIGCTSSTIYGHNVTSCLKIVVTINPSALPIGDAMVSITNPAPYDCSYNTSNIVEIVATPILNSVSPSVICARDDGDTHVSIFGSQFSSPTVTLISQCDTLDCLQTADGTVVSFNSTLMDATFSKDSLSLLTPGVYGFQLTNGFTCTSDVSFTGGKTVIVRAPVTIISVEPEYIYTGLSVQGYLYTLNMRNNADPTEVMLISTATNFNVTLALATRPGWDTNYNRIRVIIPAGLTPGFYDVKLTSPDGCVAILHSAYLVGPGASNIDLSVYPNAILSGADPISVAFDALPTGVSFVSAPRIYLYQAGSTAIEITGFTFSASELLATVPSISGVVIPVGVYDVYVINPTGDVGYLPGGFIVSSNMMPSISIITPYDLIAGSLNTVTLTGTNFGAAATSLTASCIDFYNSSTTASFSATISTFTSTSIQAQFDLTAVASPNTLSCVVTLVNSEGIMSQYTGVRIQTTAGGADWEPDLANFNTLVLNKARTAHATAIVSPTPTSSFLYVFSGTTTGGSYTNTVEYAAIDKYGRVTSPFTYARSDHNTPRAVRLASATVAGSFVYFGGGIDSSSSYRTEIYRAYVMPPSSAPVAQGYLRVITDQLTVSASGGIHYYCISANHDSNDPKNPDGETLCSSPIAVRFPANRGQYLEVQLRWSALSNVAFYNIYRTPNLNDPPSAMALYDTTSNLQYTDDFQNGVGSQKPLFLGALGDWDNVNGNLVLQTARAGLSLVSGPRSGSSTLYSVFALFGSTSGTSALTSYEYLLLDLTTSSELAGSAQFTSVSTSVPARTQHGAVVVSSTDTTNVPVGQTNIYIPGGLDNTLTPQNDYRVATITNTGTLTFSAVTCTTNCYTAASVGTGYCLLASGSEISMWGGSLSTGGVYNTIQSSTTLSDSASSTAVMNVARSSAACASNQGVQYISGGSASGTPSAGVQYRLA